jgi:uncharacterized membrane protein
MYVKYTVTFCTFFFVVCAWLVGLTLLRCAVIIEGTMIVSCEKVWYHRPVDNKLLNQSLLSTKKLIVPCLS